MARKAEDILKSQGLSDADITAMAPMLNDPRYRAAIENSYSALETERDGFKARNDEWEQLQEKNLATLKAAEEEAIRARRDAADKAELLRVAKDFGYLNDDEEKKKQAEIEAQRRQQQQQQGWSPDDPRFVQFARDFSTREGDAIAMYGYLSEEYRALNGGSINDYVNGDKRGMVAIRAEALKANKPIDQYMGEKFNWDQKRAEQAQKRKDDERAALRREVEQEMALKYSQNPNLSGAHISRNSFSPIRQSEDGKMPWDNGLERRQARLQRAMESEAKARVM